MSMPSASSMPLVSRCASSFVLPRVRNVSSRSAVGDAIHEHMRERAAYGVDEAMQRLYALARRFELNDRETGIFIARCRSFEWIPPAGSFGEVALCLLENGEVVGVTGGKGQYETPDGALTAATLDVMWSEPTPLDLSDPTHPRCPPDSVLWVVDYKSGDEAHVDPIESNVQLATQALLAARWTGAQQVVPAILFVRKGQGEWDVPEHAWGARELRNTESKIREILARVQVQQKRLTAGEPLELVDGPHCNFCPARTRCPAQTGIFKQIFSGTAPFGDAPLSAEERVWLAERLSMIESMAKKARWLLRADVDENGPIALSDGNVWGPTPEKRTEIVAHVAMSVLQEELGEQSTEAVVVSITRDGIERAAKAHCEAKKIQRGVAPLVRKLMAKLGEAGALLESQRLEYRAHKPERVLPTTEVADG